MVKPADMLPLDRYAMDLALTAHARVEEAYLNYEFHKVFHTLHGLCATDLSSFYLDVLKDRLYSSLPDSRERRSAQTALYEILRFCCGIWRLYSALLRKRRTVICPTR